MTKFSKESTKQIHVVVMPLHQQHQLVAHRTSIIFFDRLEEYVQSYMVQPTPIWRWLQEARSTVLPILDKFFEQFLSGSGPVYR